MLKENEVTFVGIDLTDPYAKHRRPCTRALLSPDLCCTFDEWEYDNFGIGMIPANVSNSRFIAAIDGPQGLANSPDRTMRACERKLGAAGKSTYEFPTHGRPFAGFVTGSVRLFWALHNSREFNLYGVSGVELSRVNLIEVYPGAAWQIFAEGNSLPKKTKEEGKNARLNILKRNGLTFSRLSIQSMATHDELDAALAAYTAYLFANHKTKDHGEPPFEDAKNQILREGFIIQPY